MVSSNTPEIGKVEEKLDEKITKFLDNLDYNNDVSREMVESRINEIVVAGDNLGVIVRYLNGDNTVIYEATFKAD